MANDYRVLWNLSGGKSPTHWAFHSMESLLKDSKSISVGVMYPGGSNETGIPLIRVADVKDGRVVNKPDYLISDKVDEEYKRTRLDGSELLITLVGNPGDCVVVSDYMKGWNVARALAVVRLDDPSIREWLRYVLLSPPAMHQIDSRLNTTVQRTLNLKDIREIGVPLPPKKERDAITNALNTLDNKIELNRQMNETLEAMAQALFKSWFVDFDPVIDNALAAGNAIPDEMLERAEQRKGIEKKENSDIQGLFPDEFEFTEEMGWIPKGWSISTLDGLTTELRRGISPKYTEIDGVRVVNQRCIRNHSIDYSVCRLNDASLRKVEGRYIEVGDVLVNSTGVGTLGRMAQVFYLDEPAVVDSHVTVVRPNTELIKPYTFGRLMLSIEPLVESMGLGSTGQTELSRVHLGELVVCVPPLELQGFVEKSFSSYSDKSAFNLQQNITLAKLRDTLLPKLMSGELRISDTEVLVDEVL